MAIFDRLSQDNGARDQIEVPGGGDVLQGSFARSGDDLCITCRSGDELQVEGYFASGSAADLVTGGAVVPGKMVAALSRSEPGGNDALQGGDGSDTMIGDDGQVDYLAALRQHGQDNAAAPGGEPVAEIGEFEGVVTITRADGSRVTAEVGTPLYQDDVIATSDAGSVGVSFVDGMSFSLGQNSKLLLDEFSYEPQTGDGGGLLQVLQGGFSFVSGEAAHSGLDALMIETPTMTIGVRGTKVAAQAGAEGETSKIALMAEQDGTIGKIMVSTDAGQELLEEPNKMVEVTSRFEPPSPQMTISTSELVETFGVSLSALPAIEIHDLPPTPDDPDYAPDRGRGHSDHKRGDQGERPAASDADETAAEASEETPQEGEGAGDADGGDEAAADEAVAEDTVAEDAAAETAPDENLDARLAQAETGEVQETIDTEALLGERLEAVEAGDDSSADAVDSSGRSIGGVQASSVELPSTAAPQAQEATANSNAGGQGNGNGADQGAGAGGGAGGGGAGGGGGGGGGGATPPSNTAPSVSSAIGAQNATEDSAFNLDISSNFSDPDSGDVLTYSATLTGGGALPSWLALNPSTGVFSGTPLNGDVGALSLDVTATDGGGLTAVATFSLTVANTNDAPVLDNSGAPTLTTIAEDATAPAGDTVSAIVIDGSITDPDGGAVEAIAVTSVDDTNGTWEYSTDGGTTFNAVGAVSDSSALLLDGAAVLRFVPNADYNGTATMSYRAWDQSSGSNGQSGVDTTAGTAFSAASESAAITVNAANDAPVLDNSGAPTLTAIAEDASAPAGDTVAAIVVDGSITDADGAIAEAIAITSLDSSNGTWEYSTDGGSTYNAIGAVSDSSALLLDGTAMVRFVPNADFHGEATFGFKAWDQSVGSNGQSGVDTTTGTAFSAAMATGSIDVTSVADAPVLDTSGAPTLTSVLENSTTPAGNSVESIVVDGSVTDVDGPVAEAIAVTGADNTNGTWEYSTDGGSTYNAIGAVSDSSALLLDGSAMIRFVPNASYTGTATIDFKAWDQSTGSSGQSGVDTTGSTAFSAATETATVTVDNVNDVPVLDTSGNPMLSAIAEDTTAPAGNTVAEIVVDGSITDADGAVEAIAVTAVDNSNGTWQYSTDGGTTFNAIGAVSDNAALLLNSAAMIRFVPNASYDGSATFSYKAWDQSSGSNGQSGVDTTVGTAFSVASETGSITVVEVSGGGSELDLGSGTEFQVNSYTTQAQTAPSVGELDDGGYVVVWESHQQDGSNGGIYGQRYDAVGMAVGSEFRVNSETSNNQDEPAVAGTDDGGFVVIWTSKNQDGHNDGIFGQRYDGSGDPVGSEFQVNTETTNRQEDADVVALSGGGFVVTWQSQNQDGSSRGVFGQRYDASGNTAGSEFQVNTTTSDAQENAGLTALDDGGFVAVWQSYNALTGYGVYAQRYDASGAAQGSETLVNTYFAGDQSAPVATTLDSGDFVVVWQSAGQDGNGAGIFGQRFDSSGNRVEFEFQVNSTTSGDQSTPSITALSDGGFLVAWQSAGQDGSGNGVYAQRFNADGDAIGGELLLNSTTANNEQDVDLATLSSGDVVAAWESDAQDGGTAGVYARQFDSATASVTVNAPVAAGANVIDFGGSNSAVNAGDPGAQSNDLDPGTGDFTVEAWFYYGGSNGTQTIVSKGNENLLEEGFNIFLDGDSLVVRATGGTILSSDVGASSTTMPTEHGWYHVAMVIDQDAGSSGSTVTGYLNGSSAGWTDGHGSSPDETFTTSADGISNGSDFLIGAVDTGSGQGDFFEGEIADVRVWNTARSESEIQADMARTLNGDEDNLVANWRLDEGSGTTAANSVAGGASGSITGGPSWEATSSYAMAMNGELDGRITAVDLEGDTLTFTVAGGAANGNATIDANTGAWEYTPDNGFTGTDNFSYQISDGNGGTDTVSISVNVA